jgi:predicted helicase
MDDETIYGPRAHCLTFQRAAEQGLICRYKVLVSVVTHTEVAKAMCESDIIVDGRVLKPEAIAAQIARAKACDKYGASKVFTFHQSVKAAREFVTQGPRGVGHHLSPGFGLYHVSGEMPTALRDRRLMQFRMSVRAVVSNARCLTEGVDVPAVDLVAFMSRKRSVVDIVQAIGRALRRAKGKEYGYVLVPLLFDLEEGENVDEAV